MNNKHILYILVTCFFALTSCDDVPFDLSANKVMSPYKVIAVTYSVPVATAAQYAAATAAGCEYQYQVNGLIVTAEKYQAAALNVTTDTQFTIAVVNSDTGAVVSSSSFVLMPMTAAEVAAGQVPTIKNDVNGTTTEGYTIVVPTVTITTGKAVAGQGESFAVEVSIDGKEISLTNSNGTAPSLSVSPTSLSFSSEASSQTLSVTSNGDYIYSTDVSWLTITQSSDKASLTVSSSENTEISERHATITLTSGSLTEIVIVTQYSKNERTFTLTSNGKAVTFKMKKVEGGTFQMGSTSGEDDEQPVHSVTITNDYYMGETEVTQALWYAVMGQSPTSGGSQWSNSFGLGDDRPAYYISYVDCQYFLIALNSKLSSQVGSGEQFRFPTEAEWEFAAKGGTKSKGYTYSGSNKIGDVAWYTDNCSSKTHQVKTKAANELGLYDMSGNVYEWCYDWYGSYSSGAQTDPTGPTSGSNRVHHGGCWSDDAGRCRVSRRNDSAPDYRPFYLGLRLCLGTPIE